MKNFKRRKLIFPDDKKYDKECEMVSSDTSLGVIQKYFYFLLCILYYY